MHTIFAKLLYEMEKTHDTVLVTIVESAGSSPRGAGAMMLVGESGRLLGTIGGGAVEQQTEQLAREMLAEHAQAVLRQYELRGGAPEDVGMVCGGNVTVLLQRIPGTDADWQKLAGQVVDRIAAKQPGWLAFALNGAVPKLCDTGASGAVLTEDDFILPLPIGERAIIFGGGHCAQALAPLLTTVGFRVTVMDCRPEYANSELFPCAEKIICADYTDLDAVLTIRPDDYLVVMTNGHSYDFVVQEQVLRRHFAYIGVIGSRSKTAAVNARLRERGVPEEAIQRVHTPIGTAIKAVTPAEIAVSIAGEMIYERALQREAAGLAAPKGCPMH